MSGICEIFPEDPSCAVEEPVVEEPVVEETEEVADEGEGEEEVAEEGDAEEGEGEADAEPAAKKDFGEAAATAVADWNRVKDMSGLAMLSPFMANLEFLGVASMWAIGSAMNAFRYRSDSKFYDAPLYTGDTNYWKLGDQMRLFGGLAIGGLLAVTQLLATLGIAVGLNGTVWMLVGGLGGMILSLAIGVVRFLGYEQGYANATDSTVAKNPYGLGMMGAIKTDMVEDAACNAGAAIALAGAAEGWYYNLWNAYTDEEQSAMVAEWEETIATRAMEVAEARAAMAPAAEEEGEDAEEGEEAEEGAEEGEEGEEAEEGAEEGEEGDEAATEE